jgi:hypothetical protein
VAESSTHSHSHLELSETMNDPPDYSASSVKLPPAALRLATLDFDPLGHPYYKFPPFLSSPAGTPLIPFDQFEAIGIEIFFDSDGEEVDGKGIPTVELGTKHGLAGDTEKRKKKKRAKNGDNSRNGPWWEEWGESEDLRRADCFDPYVQAPHREINLFIYDSITPEIPLGLTDFLKVHTISSKIVTGRLYYNLCMTMCVYRLLCLAHVLFVCLAVVPPFLRSFGACK